MSKYWVQERAPAGNWYDSIGTNDDAEQAKAYARAMCIDGNPARVVERTDRVILPASAATSRAVATVKADVLTDQSVVHNVHIAASNGAPVLIIGAESEQAARSIADAVNQGAAWVDFQ